MIGPSSCLESFPPEALGSPVVGEDATGREERRRGREEALRSPGKDDHNEVRGRPFCCCRAPHLDEGEEEAERSNKKRERKEGKAGGGTQGGAAEDRGEQKIEFMSDGTYEVYVHSPDMKFSCAHFVAYEGFRESLHGHNYTVSIRMSGALGPDGYVLDFGDIKKTGKDICKVSRRRRRGAGGEIQSRLRERER